MKKAFIGAYGAPNINDYLKEGFDGLITALSQLAGSIGSAYLISGCVVSNAGTTWTCGSGWVFFAGEIMRVPNHSWVDASFFASNSFAYVEVVTVPNPIAYANGNTYDLIRENTVKFKAHIAEPDPVYLLSFKSIAGAIGQKLKGSFTEAIATPGYGIILSAWANNDAGNPFSVQRTIQGNLIFKGGLNVGTGHSATINGLSFCVLLATLDAPYRPDRTIPFNVCDSGVVGGPTYITPGPGQQYILFTDGKLCLRAGNTPADLSATFFNNIIQLS